MDTGVLTEVIAAEKEVQRRIEVEELRLRERLDEVKREAADAIARAEQSDGDAWEAAMQAAEKDAVARAKRIEDEAAARAAMLERLDDERLTGVILKRMPRILRE